ncbi:MAG: CotH kinase family protein [Saprospiraceae bacterium]|nr:CotH kinase family protein [Saprospiraceae bacterium]MCF8252129.1 CotH kinase family protein [Saprospiraceae bacterium]MCF8281853.1 CotH kinase family protein [Bacteroidales bacterium]MCF8313793.1 CotH kinase family protein [Saprospiraceae bacterium]MCF8442504.1 CotH kinase family protein [Saprospiraceae bacterium]
MRKLQHLPYLFSSLALFLFMGNVVFGQKTTTNSAYLPPRLSMEFVPEGGFFTDATSVQLLAQGAAIYYTTDGSRPTTKSQRFTSPIPIEKTTVVRAFAVLKGEKSPVFSNTYFVNEPETSLPVVSLSITSSVLFDPERGLFVKGANAADSLWMQPGANFWSRREVSANFEFFEPDGQLKWHDQVGFRLFGGMSRLFPQKSVALVARSRYGDNRFRYPFFGKKGLKKFKYLVLRNSGSDFGKTHFRDALMTHLVRHWDLELQAYRPAHVYINGKYWGIYNLREKVNRHFIASHFNVDADSIDLIEHRLTQRYGSTRHYQRLLRFLEKNSLASDANFAHVASQMEVDNFLDYQVAQIFFDNQDAGGNIKYWRPQTPNGRWRWILYDTDWGFGLNDPKAYRNNSLAFHTEPNGPNWPNPPWSTFILRKLLENKSFQNQFINRFADRLNDCFATEEVLADIEEFYGRLLPEMPRHLQRWRLKEPNWQAEVQVLRNFATERPAHMRRFLMEKFNTGELRNVSLDIAHGGKVLINETIDFRDTFSGHYFEKIPIRLRAVPDLGYRFVRWEGEAVSSESPVLFLQLTNPDSWHLRAVFEKYEHPLMGKIVINEISCNNKQTGDWVELFNNSDKNLNLKGWKLADHKNEFSFPAYTLPPKGYVVVCEDSIKFLRKHPEVQSVIGGLSFGLNKRRESVQLFSNDDSAVDSVGYDLPPLDSLFTLNLLLPSLDNGDPSNWELTPGEGSPGSANAYFVTSRIDDKRSLFIKLGGAFGLLTLAGLALWLRRRV